MNKKTKKVVEIPEKVINETANEVRLAARQFVGLIIWRNAKENCKYPTSSQHFENYRYELARQVGQRGGNKRAKKIRQKFQQNQLSLNLEKKQENN